MGKSQRDKGANFERALASMLTDELGIVVKRNLGQARDSGDDITVGHWRIEAKRRARIGLIYEAMEQCLASCGDGDLPCVVVRADGKAPLFIFRQAEAVQAIRDRLDYDE